MPFADRLGREERLEQLRLVLGRHAGPGVFHLEPRPAVAVAGADRSLARGAGSACTIACSALITKFSSTCCSSVKIAITVRCDSLVDLDADVQLLELALAQLDTEATTSRSRTGDGSDICRPKRDRLRMIALARVLSFWISVEVGARLLRHVLAHLQQLGEAEDRLQRVVQLVRDARHEHADRRQPLLPDDLLLQRLQLFAHPPLLVHLRRNRLARASAGW